MTCRVYILNVDVFKLHPSALIADTMNNKVLVSFELQDQISDIFYSSII